MANTRMVELGEVQLATYLFEKTFTGQPSFQNGLPSLIAFPFGCNTANCLIRYERELYVDAVTNWFATISLPCILYYSKDSMRAKSPALVPEDADPIWSVGSKTILSERSGMKQRIGSIMNGIHNCLGDPRIGLVLLLGALMSFGSIGCEGANQLIQVDQIIKLNRAKK
ncbi:uncharacterized protein LOC114291614 isoform X1 [Camellia sinensis]|uniref:uncharacterized protein LOC114291614 isoform X1 n=1 Tax=Camellia sinensis TaxID=4442 RepID=UPI00103664F7|nr:uncharacterized protein LOC114291614 isoform X1 [Camellia sinensis]